MKYSGNFWRKTLPLLMPEVQTGLLKEYKWDSYISKIYKGLLKDELPMKYGRVGWGKTLSCTKNKVVESYWGWCSS